MIKIAQLFVLVLSVSPGVYSELDQYSINKHQLKSYEFEISREKCQDIEYRKQKKEEIGDSSELYDDYDYGECEENNEDVKNVIGKDVTRCCGEHGFISAASCPGGLIGEDKKLIAGVPVCILHSELDRHKSQVGPIQKTFCPEECSYEYIDDVGGTAISPEIFKTVENRTYFMFENRTHPFCVEHHCDNEESWKLQIFECYCTKTSEINLKATELVPFAPLCCPIHSYLQVTSSNTLTCVQDENPFQSATLERKDVRSPTCTWRNQQAFQAVNLEKDNISENVSCIGAIRKFGSHISMVGGIQCSSSCQGRIPCFRRCCPDGQFWDDSHCKEDLNHVDYFSQNGLFSEYGLQEYRQEMKSSGLVPSRNCEDRFRLVPNTSSIYLPYRNLTLNYGDFCLVERNKDNGKGNLYLQANLVFEEHENAFQQYHAYFLLVSIACLLTTILVYIFLPALLNNYSKIMLNFALSMLAAFLTLISGKMKSWFTEMDYGYMTCKFLGYLNQFCLLAMFTWMTIMSYEIFKQIKGLNHIVGKGNLKQLTKQLLIGYGLPLMIVLLAVVVDFANEGTEQDCDPLRPKFGIKYCSFHYRAEKFFWLLLPILVMLILNTLMFFYVVISICRSAAMKNDFRNEGSNRKEQVDKILLYLRLFFGMGFVWYFEIISFLLDSPKSSWTWIPDALNMLQGFWVFITFVCKRNVLNVIMKKRRKLYVSLRRSSVGEPGDKVKMSELKVNSRQEKVSSVLSTRISVSQDNIL